MRRNRTSFGRYATVERPVKMGFAGFGCAAILFWLVAITIELSIIAFVLWLAYKLVMHITGG